MLSDHFADEDTRDDLTRMAVSTGATVEVVSEHPALEELGGVGAILRYRPAL